MTGSARGVGTRRDQVQSLARTFLARFFDNEITAGSNDLKESFFWLMAFLAAPGVCAAVWMSWTWGFLATIRGIDVLRVESSADKVLYLGFGMVATGIVTAIVWQSLLVDRRDGIVLGSLPVGHRIVVEAKLLAVAGYVAIVAVSMHLLASIAFGVFLAAGNDATFAARGIAAHFVASSLGSLFVFLCAIAAQGSALVVFGVRGFARLSALLQLLFVAAIVLGLMGLPTLSLAAADTVWRTGPNALAWIVYTPPLWFLGIYETILGTDNGVMLRLGRAAWAALGTALVLSVATYPLAYRRVMRDAVEHPEGLGRIRVAAAARWVPRAIARRGVTRAVAQFLLATIGRVERHRFTIALAAGAALAWAVPALVRWRGLVEARSPADQRIVLALAIAVMTFMLLGLRVAASVPSDLRAGWVFHATDPAPRRVRTALRRVMSVLVVAPVAALAALSAALLWTPEVAVRHGTLCAAVGLLVTEYLVFDLDAVPCAAPWRPERANLRGRWPAYLFAFVLLCGAGRFSLASLELVSLQSPTANTILIAVLLATAASLHWSAGRRTAPADEDEDTVSGISVLDLS